MPLTFSHTQRIDAPVERVFSAATDLAAFAQWMPGFVGVERLSEGPLGVGWQFREPRKVHGRDSTEHFEFTAYDPPPGFTLFVDGGQGSTGKGAFTFIHRLSPLDDGAATEFTLHGEIGGMGRIMQLFARLFMGSMKKALVQDLECMSAWIAAQGDPPVDGEAPTPPEGPSAPQAPRAEPVGEAPHVD